MIASTVSITSLIRDGAPSGMMNARSPRVSFGPRSLDAVLKPSLDGGDSAQAMRYVLIMTLKAPRKTGLCTGQPVTDALSLQGSG
jgi:hypothetical protein